MNRSLSLIALVTLVLFTAACATTPATPAVKGTIASIDGKTVAVTPADGSQPVNVNLGWNTQVFWANGLEASGTSVLTTGQTVQVWTNGTTATKVVIGE